MFKSEHTLLPFFFSNRTGDREQSKNRKSDKDAPHLGGFIFFTQFSARIQFSEYGKPILSFLLSNLESFPLVFKLEHRLYLSIKYQARNKQSENRGLSQQVLDLQDNRSFSHSF